MKKFTKITLIIAGVLAAFGIVCMLAAFSMGLGWNSFLGMISDGKFSFNFGDGEDVGIYFFGDDIFDWGREEKTGNFDVDEECSELDVEFGVGTLEICYGDVEKIHIDYENVAGFSSSVRNGSLRIEGGLGISGNSDASLTITIPRNMSFEKVNLEIGASQAEITDLSASKVDVEIGAGEAVIRNLNVEKLKAETGVGQLTIEVAGAQEDYSYSLECGVGSIRIADSSYGGIGSEHTVHNPDADRSMDIECGVGEIEIEFTE